MYVNDRVNERIQVLDPDGRLLDVWDGFPGFYCIRFTADGRHLWAGNGFAHKFLKYDLDGRSDPRGDLGDVRHRPGDDLGAALVRDRRRGVPVRRRGLLRADAEVPTAGRRVTRRPATDRPARALIRASPDSQRGAAAPGRLGRALGRALGVDAALTERGGELLVAQRAQRDRCRRRPRWPARGRGAAASSASPRRSSQ